MITVPASRQDWQCFAKELPDFWNRDVVPSATGLIAWKFGGPPPGIPAMEVALDRGSKVHFMLQLRDENDLDMESVLGSAEAMGFLKQWDTFIEATDDFLAIEKPLWASVSGVDYVVKPDRLIRRGRKTLLVDIKTKSKSGKPPNEDEQLRHGLEIAAQRLAVMQRLEIIPDWSGCLYVWPDKKQLLGYNGNEFIDKWGQLVGEWADAQKQWRPDAEAQPA